PAVLLPAVPGSLPGVEVGKDWVIELPEGQTSEPSSRKVRWLPVPQFRGAFIAVVKIVTAFTLAHSITMSLAALGFVQLPSRLVESCIAASVAIAALNNIWPFFRERAWLIAFVFGLVHGFGFASVLRDLGLPRSSLALALVGFNLGVEA